MKIKIASWNIAGGRTLASLSKQFDYKSENIPYFSDQLKKLSPDIICLQESQSNKSRSLGKIIGEELGFKNIFDTIHNRSHIDADYFLTLSIISRHPFLETQSFDLPNPNFTKKFPDGRQYYSFDEKIQLVKINDFYIANSMFLPLGVFDEKYDSPKNNLYVSQLEACLLNLPKPLIFCSDFNFSNPQILYPKFYKDYKVKNSLGNWVTRPHPIVKRLRPDKILYTPEFKLVDSKVLKTQTDHYLCYTEFEVSSLLINRG